MNQLVQLRHHLHQYPELSGQEVKTARHIIEFVTQFNPSEIHNNIGGTGVAVVYTFGNSGPTIAFRCELDALPIREENDLPYKSNYQSISHKCGHDGHMATVAGMAPWLEKQIFDTGSVILLFQPAEENGKGAQQMLDDPTFHALGIDYMFALHNIPQEDMHKVLVMDSGFSAEVISFSLTLKGKESHASSPETGNNPALALSEIIRAFADLENTDSTQDTFSLLTPVYSKLGQKSYGISPSDAEIHYTIRTWSTTSMTELKNLIVSKSSQIVDRHKLTYNIDWFEHFPASQNNSICNELVKQAADVKNIQWINKETPFRFGEDFGRFSSVFPTAMFGLGSGIETPALHDAAYDFPDELIETGTDMFKGIVELMLTN